MAFRIMMGLILALGLALPGAADAATAKKGTAKKSAASSKKAASSGDKFRKSGEGPLGAFVKGPEQQVFINIAGFLYGMPTLGYERALGADNSFTGQVGIRQWGGTGFNINYLGLLGSYRWYLGEHAKMQGFYAGPLGTIQFVNVNYDATTVSGLNVTTRKESATSTIFGVGGEGGYQWILPMGLTFSGGLNAGYYFGSINLAAGAPSFSISGFGAGLNGTVGYAF